MKPAIRNSGRLAIGEVYRLKGDIQAEYAERLTGVTTEPELLTIARQEGFDFEFIIRASQDDWDNYETSNWLGVLQWIEENPEHLQRQDMIDMLHSEQDLYIKCTREYLGWAMYVLKHSS
jgi:trans-aconitate methyltransferase